MKINRSLRININIYTMFYLISTVVMVLTGHHIWAVIFLLLAVLSQVEVESQIDEVN